MSECCGDLMQERIDRLFQALPARNNEELAARLDLPEQTVRGLLSHLRKHAIEHGWTVPHVRRGPTPTQERYFAVLVDPTGKPYFDADTIDEFHEGLRGTASHVNTLCQNEARAVRLLVQRVKSRIVKRMFTDLADDLDYVGRKAHAVEVQMAEAEENGVEVSG